MRRFHPLSLLLLRAAGVVRAATYDAALDFSTSSNPTGGWSYGTTTTLGGSFSLLSATQNFASGQIAGWGNGETFPFVMLNLTSGSVTDGTTQYPAATVALHPSNGGDFAVLRWTAPATGAYQVSVTFSDIPNDANATVDVHGLLNGSAFYNAGLTAVPEPAWAAIVLGLGAALVVYRRRR